MIMEHYLVSARKYRPSTFASVVGQKALAATLKNAITSNRLAHAYLFCGSRGVGKTSCARIFAKTINCTNRTAAGEACNECPSCRQFNENRSLNIIELDAASNNGVDDIRLLQEQVQVQPVNGQYRVFIVDEVHMLTSAAFNAFLKTLEEPPSYVIFILATTEKHKVIPTILSRCQIYDFNRITVADMIEHLQYVASQEGITAEPAALNVIAQKADGAMRDALSIFDQVAASSLGNITYASTIENLNVLDSAYYNRLLEAFLDGNVADALLIYKEIRDHGFNNHFFLTGLGDYFRDLVVARDPRTIDLLETDDEHRKQMAELAAKCTPKMLYRAMDLCNTADIEFRTAANKQFLVELTLIKLCQADSPSPGPDGGNGEGQKLQPIAATAPTAKPATAAPQLAPKTAPAPAPAPAPTTSSPITTPDSKLQATPHKSAPKHVSLGPKISIRPEAIMNAEAESVKAAANNGIRHTEHRAEPYTDAALAITWQNCAGTNPAAVALNNILKTYTPKRVRDDAFNVCVESDAQQKILVDNMARVLEFVRSRLHNDNITVSVEVTQGEGSPAIWTESEVYEKMLASNPALKSLAETFNLTLD